MINHVIKMRKWISMIILSNYSLILLPEHYKIIIPIINELNEMEKNPQENDIFVANYTMNKDSLHNHYILKFVIKNFKSFSQFFYRIFNYKIGKLHIIEAIKELLNEEPTEQNMNNLFYIYDNSFDTEFKKEFFNELKATILDTSLNPIFRTNKQILLKVADFFIKNVYEMLPIETTQLIDFLLLFNDDNILTIILELCSRFGIKNLCNVYYLLEEKFLNSMKITEFNYDTIKNVKAFIKILPDFLDQFQAVVYDFTSKLLDSYYSTRNDKAFELFALLLNKLAPERSDNKSVNLSDSYIYDIEKPIQEQLFPEIPKSLKSQSNFWFFYESIQFKFMKCIQNEMYLYNSFPFLDKYPEVIDFQTRSRCFLQRMKRRIDNMSVLYVIADRMDIVESSFEQLKDLQPEDFIKILNVAFIGEEIAIDGGGVTVNWLYSLTQQIFNPVNNLFDSFSTNGGYKPSPKSSSKPNYLEYFKFAGRIVARSIIQNVCIDAHMAPFFYKCILHHPIKLADLKEYDEKIYDSLQWLIDNDIEENGIEMYYELDIKDSNGEMKHIELIENGSNVQVTNDNKNDYVLKVAEFYLKGSIKEQCDAFCEGFDSLIPHDQINIFTQGEMDLLICGITEFTDEDFVKLVSFEPPYNINTPVIKFFFSAVSKWSKEDRARLLLFITSTSKFPVNINGNNRIVINRGTNSNYLPVAHTCFRQLDLPEYESEEILNEKLLYAIHNCPSFTIG